ncbi:Borealin N terminal-domain-containing protein [Xylaria sp. CBS 124048]|nr:Borealin N terminal-domain-containing protein [Xylaria sp. CBS 124048]
MSPVPPRKRKSDVTSASPRRSPIKKRKMGITLAQKQALIDNLQLEITERARRLRAQYNIQAQQLRSRVEMRVNRIPRTLRRLKMIELPARSLPQPPSRHEPKPQYIARPLPVPTEREESPKHATPRRALPPSSETGNHKRLRNEIPDDKENQGEGIDGAKKRPRGGHANAPIAASQVLSPTSSNTRVIPRDHPASPAKPTMGRPVSPVKTAAAKASSNILSNVVDKTKAARPVLTAKPATTSFTASTNGGPIAPPSATTTGTARGRKTPAPPSTASIRGRRKASVTSESSEESSTTMAKKTATTAPKTAKAAPAVKKTATGSVKSAAVKKAPATKTTAPTAGRALRKRA